MRNRKLNILWVVCLAATLGLAAACRKTETTTTAAAVTPETGMTTTTTTTTTTTSTAADASGLVPVDSAVVTADPVIVSQRNATRRRTASQAKPASSSSNRSGRPGSSEERLPPARAERVVPEGTILRVAFDEPISTATARIGDTVRGRVLDDVLADDGSIVAASGSRVVGKIENVVDSGKLARRAELKFRLTDLETRAGNAAIHTSAYERVGDPHTKRNVGYIAGGAAVGAILGQVLGQDTDSTLKGAAAGAAVGTGVAAVTGDLDFTIEPGRTVAFTLEEPLRVR
jgi:hypothetical protein